MMSWAFKQLFFARVCGFIYSLVVLLVLAQDQSGFISIDCGLQNSSGYIDGKTGIKYIPDTDFVDTGEKEVVSDDYASYYSRSYSSLRSFPDGVRNCYKINVTSGTKYLIRASFHYGNYDEESKLPEFELRLGPNLWDTVRLESVSFAMDKELIHVPLRNYIHVCLVNKGFGVPFISGIQLRPLNNSSYETEMGSLALVSRYDTGLTADLWGYRYPDDIHDRFWYFDNEHDDWTQLNTSSPIDSEQQNNYQPASIVMSTAATPKNTTDPLTISFRLSDGADQNAEYCSYLHFAEVEKLQANQSRQFNITMNGESTDGPFSPKYLYTYTSFSTKPWRISGQYVNLSMIRAENSTLPPILNAYEIYMVKNFSEAETNQDDVDSITSIKSTYKIGKNWQGDPCSPQDYLWEGVKCSYKEFESPRIISLNLSSSGLTGEIAPIFNLTMIQSLDLSNNNLTGPIPEFLSEFSKLTFLNLEKNKLTGPVPVGLIERKNNGLLSLSLCENPNLSEHFSCELEKKHRITIHTAVYLLGFFILASSTIFAVWVAFKWKRRHDTKLKKNFQNGVLKSQGQRFTYSEIVKITNNFASVIGKGGFGEVYFGTLKDKRQVAVKRLIDSRSQGSDEFENEVILLMTAHHRNLVSLIGYCYEGDTMALVYDYIANGNLEQHILSDVTKKALTWKERLQIAVDAAGGLEYLHNGRNPPIVHRDMKTSNILLNENLQAKIADFGISKGLATESVTHVSTGPKGTFGYLDPEYCRTGQLNKKSDVYSFGIVLLELITGRAAIIRDLEEEPIHICQWVSPKLKRMEIESIVDSRIQGTYLTASAQKAIEIAMACVPPTAIQRPDINVVYNDLKKCLEIEMPSAVTTIIESDDESDENDTISSSSSIMMISSHIRPERCHSSSILMDSHIRPESYTTSNTR